MNMTPISRILILITALTSVATAQAAETGSQLSDLVPEGYRAIERQRFNLGAESGSYTDWYRYDLAPFAGFATVLEIPVIHGKSRDKWAAVAKIRFIAGGEGKQPSIALAFQADRKTERIHGLFQNGDEVSRFEIDFARKERVPIQVLQKTAGNLTVTIGNRSIEIPVPFEIDSLSLVGSGLDVTFSPFVLLTKAGAPD
jgi:hypothetical protein